MCPVHGTSQAIPWLGFKPWAWAGTQAKLKTTIKTTEMKLMTTKQTWMDYSKEQVSKTTVNTKNILDKNILTESRERFS
jgi:hypothetical protein